MDSDDIWDVLLLARLDGPQLTATAWEAFILKYSKELTDFLKAEVLIFSPFRAGPPDQPRYP